MTKFSDDAVIKGTKKWIELVKTRELCPFADTFGKRNAIVVERSLHGRDILTAGLRLLDDKDLNMTTVVLPTLPIPADNSWTQHPNEMVPAIVMGQSLVDLRRLMAEAGLLDTVLIPVNFNPCFLGGAQWAPWPTIQIIKVIFKLLNPCTCTQTFSSRLMISLKLPLSPASRSTSCPREGTALSRPCVR